MGWDRKLLDRRTVRRMPADQPERSGSTIRGCCDIFDFVDVYFGPCAPPKAYTDLEDGEYTFEVRAYDGYGRPALATRSFTVAAGT